MMISAGLRLIGGVLVLPLIQVLIQMLVLVMAQMLGLLTSFMPAIRRDRCPAELERQQCKKDDGDAATHDRSLALAAWQACCQGVAGVWRACCKSFRTPLPTIDPTVRSSAG